MIKKMYPWNSTMRRAAVSRNRCFGCQSENKSSASEGQNMDVNRMKCPNMQHHGQYHLQARAEMQLSNIKRENLGILQGLEKFHCYCLTCKVSVIRDHKMLVAIFKIFKWNVVSLSQGLQRILYYYYASINAT